MKKVKNTIPVFDICSLKSEQPSSGDIIVAPFGRYLEAHPNLQVPHRHSFYHMVLFTKGGGTHSIDFQEFAVEAGQVYFMKPGQVHSWKFEGETDGYVINFSEQFFNPFLLNRQYLEQFLFFQGIADACVINLDSATFSEAVLLAEKSMVALQHPGAQQQDLIRVYLIALFLTVNGTVAKQHTISGTPHAQVLLYHFRKLVDAHYAEMRLPKEYAAMLYITPNHLNALCKDLLDKPAGEVIRDRILLEAKRLLINADIGIAAIAAQLDFTDHAHFTRFFKKHTSATPEEFRRNATVTPKK